MVNKESSVGYADRHKEKKGVIEHFTQLKRDFVERTLHFTTDTLTRDTLEKYLQSLTNSTSSKRKQFMNRVFDTLDLIRTDRSIPLTEMLIQYDIVTKLATKGLYKGKQVRETNPGRRSETGNGDVPLEVRGALAMLAAQNEDLADVIVEEDIMGAHGSTSGSLLDILDHGLRPQQYLDEHAIMPTTGEVVYEGAGINQEYVSFTEWTSVDTLALYAGSVSGEKGATDIRAEIERFRKASETAGGVYRKSADMYINQRMKVADFLDQDMGEEDTAKELIRRNFPVIYFINDDSFKDSTDPDTIHYTKNKDLDEFLVKGGVPPSDIRIILVPREQISLVRQQVQKRGLTTEVFPIEDYFSLKVNSENLEKGLVQLPDIRRNRQAA